MNHILIVAVFETHKIRLLETFDLEVVAVQIVDEIRVLDHQHEAGPSAPEALGKPMLLASAEPVVGVVREGGVVGRIKKHEIVRRQIEALYERLEVLTGNRCSRQLPAHLRRKKIVDLASEILAVVGNAAVWHVELAA